MNQYLYHQFAQARETEIRITIQDLRVADEWSPRRRIADRVGQSLVHLGVRFLSDKCTAERIERQLHPRAA